MRESGTTVQREFDAKAAVYESNRLAVWYMAQSERIVHHLSLQSLQAGDVVLDIGCGTGYLLRRIVQSHPGVIGIGIDVAPRMVAFAREKATAEALSDLTFVQSDWECLTGEARALLTRYPITCAICASALHYFRSPAIAIRAIHDVLRPGGRLLILERAREKSLLTAIWHYMHRFVVLDNVRFYSSVEICEMIARAGFGDVSVVARLKRVLWKNKLYTSLALVQGTKPWPSEARLQTGGAR